MMHAAIARLPRAAAFILALAVSLAAMSLPAAADLFGRWQTFNGLGFTFTFDVQAQTGSPGGTRTLSGEITPTNTFDADCGRAKPGDRLYVYICERLSKDGPFPMNANLNTARGQPILTGTDINTGATLQLTMEQGTSAPLAKLVVSLERFDGTIETMTLAARKRDVRTAPQALVGDWIGSDGGLTLEARVEPVDEDRVAVTVSAFADQALPVPAGRPLDEWHRVAGAERAFSMSATAGRQQQQPQAFWTTLLTREGEFADRVGAGTELKPTPSGNLQMVFTGAGLGGVLPVYVTFARADRPLRQVAPTRSVPDMMTGQWIGNSGPLVIEADIEMNDQGEATAIFHAFEDQSKGNFPGNPARAFTWFHEIVVKRAPFALTFEGSWDGRDGVVAGRGESGKTKDFGIGAATRIRRVGADELSLSIADPRDDAFSGQPMQLTRRSTPLRAVPPLEAGVATPAAESSLAGTWVWSSGPNRRGNVIILELAGEELRSVEGSIKVWNTDGSCETFQRTQALCELGRDDGPLANAIRFDPTGDDRWPYDALEGLRAFGKNFPAYSDLRARLRMAANGMMLVQMTAADAFGTQPDNTYMFERVGANDAILVPSLDDRVYVATQGDPAGGACEAWAKDDSLLRQKNLPELTAKLDAILANQKIGLSGHPRDVQCKRMLDDMAEAGLDPAKEDGGASGGGRDQQTQDPAASGPVAGTWRMVGQPHFSHPAFSRWGPAPALRPILTEIEISGREGRYSASEKNGPFASTLTTQGVPVEALRVHFEKSIPETGAASLMEWLGTPDAYLAGGGGNGLGWLDDQDSFYQEIGLLVAGDRALLLTSGQFFGDGGLAHLHMIGVAPQAMGVAAFERVASRTASPSLEGTWVRLGETYRDVPAEFWNIWASAEDFTRTVPRLTIKAANETSVLEIDGKQIAPLTKLEEAVFPRTAKALKPFGTPDGFFSGRGAEDHLKKPHPESGGQTVAEWLCCDAKAYVTVGTGATDVFPGLVATQGMHDNFSVLFLIGDQRAVAMVHTAHQMTDSTVFVALFQRNGAPPAPEPRPAPSGQDVVDADPVKIPVPPAPEPNAVCTALERRTADLNARAGTELVQAIRSIYADAGLAFGGEQTEAKCQRALDQLNAIVLAPDTRGNGQSGQTGGGAPQGNVYLVDNSVNVYNTFVDNGGDWYAPDAPDPCATLDTFAATLTFSGGMGLGGFIDGLFVDVGLSASGPRRPDLCYDAMLYMWDFGLDPALEDGGWGIVQVIYDADPAPRRLGRDPAESRACRAYNAFTSALLQTGGTELVQFLRGYAIDQGFGMGSTRDPSPADCARMLAELRDLGLDPDLPDGGFAFASDLLPDEPAPPPSPAPLPADRAGTYDARPEAELELASWLVGAPYTYAVPMTGGLQHMGDLAGIVAFVTPPAGMLGGERARAGDGAACMEGRRLPREEGFRAWAAMRELMRHFVPPGSILSGRDCALVEVATEMAFATMGDPSFTHGENEFVSVTLDRRLDGAGLSADDLQLAGRTVGAMLREPEPTQTHPWRAVVTTPDIVAAVTGYVVPDGSFLVWNHLTGGVAGPFRMQLTGDAP